MAKVVGPTFVPRSLLRQAPAQWRAEFSQALPAVDPIASSTTELSVTRILLPPGLVPDDEERMWGPSRRGTYERKMVREQLPAPVLSVVRK